MIEVSEYLINKELEIIPNTGFYKNKEEFVNDAINTLLAARKDLRISIACELYRKDAVSLGKACEIASLDIEEMKEVLHEKGIVRKVHTTPVEMEAMVKEAIKRSGR